MAQTDVRKFNDVRGENKIKFSSNWNSFMYDGGKLKCKFFTTIRKPDSFGYYEQRVGEVFDVLLEERVIGKAILKDATLTSIDKITPELLVIDTGTTFYKTLFEKFHVIDKCILLLFERVE